MRPASTEQPTIVNPTELNHDSECDGSDDALPFQLVTVVEYGNKDLADMYISNTPSDGSTSVVLTPNHAAAANLTMSKGAFSLVDGKGSSCGQSGIVLLPAVDVGAPGPCSWSQGRGTRGAHYADDAYVFAGGDLGDDFGSFYVCDSDKQLQWLKYGSMGTYSPKGHRAKKECALVTLKQVE